MNDKITLWRWDDSDPMFWVDDTQGFEWEQMEDQITGKRVWVCCDFLKSQGGRTLMVFLCEDCVNPVIKQ